MRRFLNWFIASRLRYKIGIFIGLLVLVSSIWYMKNYEILPVSAINIIQELPAIKSSDKVLIFAPHPDDETLGACGFMQKANIVGAKSAVVVVTDGNKRGKASIRIEEVTRAVDLCSNNEEQIYYLNFPDGKLQNNQDLRNKIKTIFDEFKPTIVLTTDPSDTHNDHSETGKAVNEVTNSLKDRPLTYDYLIHYHRYPRPEGLKTNDPLLPPATLVDGRHLWYKLTLTKEEENKKQEAIMSFNSQLGTPLLKGLMLSFIRTNEIYSAHGE